MLSIWASPKFCQFGKELNIPKGEATWKHCEKRENAGNNTSFKHNVFMLLKWEIKGILFYGCLSVCLSVCLSAELNIFLWLPYYSSYNAGIRYAGSFRWYPTSEGHIIKVKVEYQGYIFKKMAILGALVFHKHILFICQSLTSSWEKSFVNPFNLDNSTIYWVIALGWNLHRTLKFWNSVTRSNFIAKSCM